MANALIKHEQIITTLPKAKELKSVIDKVITLGKNTGKFHTVDQAFAQLRDEAMVAKLFDTLAKTMKARNGGYSLIAKAGSVKVIWRVEMLF